MGSRARAYVNASVVRTATQQKTKLTSKQLSRTRRFAMAVSVLLLLASGFLVLFIYQYKIAEGSKKVAEDSKEEAEKRFAVALELATKFVGKTD